MKTLPPCDHDECPPTHCMKTQPAQTTGVNMTLQNTVVQITVMIPKVELRDEEIELTIARNVLYECAINDIENIMFTDSEMSIKILDCPSYPALNE